MRYLFLLSVILLSASGCALIGAGGIGDAVYTSAKYGKLSYCDTILKSDFSLRQLPVGSKPVQYSDIEAEWGKTNDLTVEGNNKSVTYKTGLRWKGIILMPIIPIPLAIPIGQKSVTFHFENDYLINWTIHDDHYCISYVGFILIPFGGEFFGPISETSCQWHKDMNPTRSSEDMACDVPFYDKCYPPNIYNSGRGRNLK